jgi:hypothetical protein
VPAPPEQRPPAQPSPAQPPNLPALALSAPPRLPAAAALSVYLRRDAAADRWMVGGRREAAPPAPPSSPLQSPQDDDRKTLIRLAIARLETQVTLIEGQHG